MVAAQEAEAARVGLRVLQQGGNAIDAAVAMGFVLAVTLPKAGNLGGGGFMLVHLGETGKTHAIDFREMAPAAAHRDMYLDESGDVDNRKARFSYASSGVPGTPAGLLYALEKYGTQSRKAMLAPAIKLAGKGVVVSHGLSHDLDVYQKRLFTSPAARAVFLKADGTAPKPGDRLVQKDLAKTLSLLAKKGREGFYTGRVAQLLVTDMKANGGLITLNDMTAYKVRDMHPVRGTYRGYDIVSMPPPSSGGVHLVQMLNILEGWPLGEYGANSARTLHLMAESMKLAFADRSEHLGDPDFFQVPVAGLVDKGYARQLRAGINQERARPSSEIKPGTPPRPESPDTTHFSIIDGRGNAVAVTYTLNFSFGSGQMAPGTGFLLNNEMDDFSSKPGVPNAFGLVGGEANGIKAGKRPLSSMTPTMVFKDDKPFLVTGSPGGSRIITAVLQVIMNVIDHDMNMAEASSVPRIHHQWLPDELGYERGISPDTLTLLEQLGHKPVQRTNVGSTQSIMWRDGHFYGASDPRRVDALTLGY